MADREPRSSIDHEEAPLLRDPEREGDSLGPPQQTTFSERMNAVVKEPLTPLTNILLVLALALLLVSSVFIGLFAGAQHKLALERDRSPGKTITRIFTTTEHQTLPGTRTRVITTTETATSTKTEAVSTTTVGRETTTIRYTKTAKPVPVPTGNPESDVCMEPRCILFSADILSSLDVTQDPCENFYEFSNNGWLNANPLSPAKTSWGRFEALDQSNKNVVQKILTSDFMAQDSYDAEVLRKLRDMYSSCLDEGRLSKVGSTPLQDFIRTLRDLFKGKTTDIPATRGGKKSQGLTAALAFMHSRGIDSLFSFSIEGDVGVDQNQMTLWFSQPGLGLPSKQAYEDESIKEVYQTAVERLLTIFNDSGHEDENNSDMAIANDSKQKSFSWKDKADRLWPPWPWPPWDGDEGGGDDGDDKPPSKDKDIAKLAESLVKFESRIAKATLDQDAAMDPVATYNPVSSSEFFDSLHQIDFSAYLASFTPRSFPDRVILTDTKYPKALADILEDTADDVIEAYLVARTALALSPYLGMDTDAWKAQRTLVEALTGIKKGAVPDRGEYCVSMVESTLGYAAGRYFVNETFSDESKTKATKTIMDIVGAFKKSVLNLDWMDRESATAAAAKADALTVKVGYPLSPDTRSSRSISQYYSTVKVDAAAFFGNVLHARSNAVSKEWLRLGKRRDKGAWDMLPFEVNAYYDPPANEIAFPAGILQSPFFSSDWPGYALYGAFGHLAGHELTHAFDPNGRHYNQEGKLAEWWTNSTSEAFEVKRDCIVKQFSEYTIDDGKGGKVHVNGNFTAGENVGDSGLIQAYRAWKAQYKQSLQAGGEYMLPGLPYTKDQLFFITFAYTWARKMTPQEAVQRINTDPHSPVKYRVDGSVANIPEFAEAFKCSPKAKLNPPLEKRCMFWS